MVVSLARKFSDLIASDRLRVGVVGLGYVGLPLAIACARAGMLCTGFEIDPAKRDLLNAGVSYIEAVGSGELADHLAAKTFRVQPDVGSGGDCDVIVVCLPTPLSRIGDPDLAIVEAAMRDISKVLRRGQMVILESTSYPGTTDQLVRPILETSGLKSGVDFFLGFSPEREDPGNKRFTTTAIPKVVSGDGPEASELVKQFYARVFEKVVPVSTTATAEAVKITENIFRAVNIALVNELKVAFEGMDIDIWEVIEAASTKPFGYMPFYPGPGVGGHCIPVDPSYFVWQARQLKHTTTLIEAAININRAAPTHVVNKALQALRNHGGVGIPGSKCLVVGLAYKKNVGDIRESPAIDVIKILTDLGVHVEYHDPFVPECGLLESHGLPAMTSMALTPESLSRFDLALVITDHDNVDYAMIAESVPIIVDTRNVIARKSIACRHLVKA